MSPPKSFDDKKPVVVKSKRGRKALAVREGHIDTTGRTHIMTVRRTKPPTPKKKTTTPKPIKQTNIYCKRCEQSDKYIDLLNDRIGKLEALVNKLTNGSKLNDDDDNKQQPFFQPAIQTQNISNIGTQELLNLSSQISIELFERFDQIQLQTPIQPPIPTTTLTPPVSPFPTCEQVDFTVDWNVFPQFTQPY
ncbi:15044_t:CDS:1 [Funneliformis geosporum]|uniref:13100_t:CDS:1 n=1 Tax=Funneliformis geosporum TaxID=1117311 RepID=A0A9W4WR79_9GLOM|nr:15044_t:CDS:1 [Funneliformis geosporum]CAI2180332.1 13100_t:CDS:1 [Funneliformis geosporum]